MNEERKELEIVEEKEKSVSAVDERSMYDRLKFLVVNGKKLSNPEAVALAQFSVSENLDPFASECYYIPGVGPVIGIAGLRRKAREALAKEFPGEYHGFSIVFADVTSQFKVNEPDIYLAYKATLRDTLKTKIYLQLYEKAKSLYETSDEIISAVGRPPLLEAVAVMYQNELNPSRDAKFHPTERCQKRAEALVIKKRFNLSYQFGDEEFDIRDFQVISVQWEQENNKQLDNGAEFTDNAPVQQSKPDNGTRPYPPEIVKSKLEAGAKKHEGKTATQAQVNLMVGMLDVCFASGDAEIKRHEVCSYLTGEASSKKIPGNYVLAMLDWLKPEKLDGGEYKPDPMAAKEAQAILTARAVEAGQQQLI